MAILNSNLLLGKSLNAFSHTSPSQCLFVGLSLCLGALLTWRVWRFTITPWLHPDEPVEVPYWMPFLGHARAFLSNQDALLSYCREYFKNSRQPFALTLGREKLYILTGYDDIVAAYKNNTTLDYGPVIDTLMHSFGITTESTKKMFQPTDDFIQRTRAYNPHGKNFFKLKSDFYHAQLHPGPRFEQTQQQFLTLLSDAMQFDNIPTSVIRESTEKTKSVSLYRLCQEVFVRIGTKVFFGQQFLDLNPRLVHDFIDFDDYNWMVFYDWPQRAVATNPLRKVLDVIEAYLDLPKTERPDAAWMIELIEDAQGQLDTRKEDVAVVLLMLMWVINTNAYRVAFWILAYLYHSEDLLSALKAETAASVRKDGSVDVPFLMKNSPRLDAIWFEILRLTNASSAMRTALEPTVIGGKLMKPGYKIMSPFRQLHFDKSIFGATADTFDPDRFLKDKELSNHPSYKPFGGGLTMCPGRFVARQEVYIFVTLILHRFESRLTPKNQPMPKFELNTPTTGIISPVIGDDVHLVLQAN